jgi:methyl coenzyme M reductase gamma subunit
MNLRDILKELYENRVTEAQVDELASATLGSSEGANVEALLGFSNAEWTAHAQGASFSEIAFWRYHGWPKNCVLCGHAIDVKDFGWFIVDVDGISKLKHIMCP